MHAVVVDISKRRRDVYSSLTARLPSSLPCQNGGEFNLITFGPKLLAFYLFDSAVTRASHSLPKVRSSSLLQQQDCGARMSIVAQQPSSHAASGHAASNKFDSSLTVVNVFDNDCMQLIWWSFSFAHNPFRVVFVFSFLAFCQNFELNSKFKFIIPFY